MTPRGLLTATLCAAAAWTVTACSGAPGGPDPPAPAPPAPAPPAAVASDHGEVPAAEPAWFTVDAVEEERLRAETIYRQAYERPRLSEPLSVEWPASGDPSGARLLIVQAVLSERGRVARAHILRRRPADLELSEELRARLTEALRQADFEPARVRGEPVAVYYNLTIELRQAPAAEQ